VPVGRCSCGARCGPRRGRGRRDQHGRGVGGHGASGSRAPDEHRVRVSAVVLARRHVLVQELPAVEGLARVDVLCVDKTGTITEPRPVYQRFEPRPHPPPAGGRGCGRLHVEALEALGALAAASLRTTPPSTPWPPPSGLGGLHAEGVVASLPPEMERSTVRRRGPGCSEPPTSCCRPRLGRNERDGGFRVDPRRLRVRRAGPSCRPGGSGVAGAPARAHRRPPRRRGTARRPPGGGPGRPGRARPPDAPETLRYFAEQGWR